MLLMVEAYNGNIVCPNKQVDPLESFHEGHLLESETYIGTFNFYFRFVSKSFLNVL